MGTPYEAHTSTYSSTTVRYSMCYTILVLASTPGTGRHARDAQTEWAPTVPYKVPYRLLGALPVNLKRYMFYGPTR